MTQQTATNQGGLTQTAPLPDGPGQAGYPKEYLFIEGLLVVGTVVADCAVCAWREGHGKWPDALMACWCADVSLRERCSARSSWSPRADLRERLASRGRMN